MSTGFIHLHLHTSYSLLDGACRPEDAVQAAVANEMPAVSITDHGVLYGAMEFYKAARRQGIKPVIGCEAYVARDSSGQAHGPHTDTAAPDHLLLLAETDQGYRNLIQLVSSSFLASPPPRPRTSKATLASCRKGLIAISAGRSGEAARHILAGNFDEARRTVREYAAIFGKDNFFLEIQDHGLESEARVNAGMSRLAAETGVPLVATNNVHYIAREHAWIHEVLLCLQSQTLMSDTARPTLPGSEYCFKSAAEMESLFGWSPGAVARSGEIADRCDVRLGPSDMHFPTFPVPAGHSAGSYLEHLCFAGLRDSFGIALPAKAGDHAGVDAVDRARRELDIIRRTGYANYYLVVWDFVQFARRRGIPVGLRGSGGASLVAYAMGITDIDPVRHSLVFEMFLNPGRAAPPDFDIDVCQTRRGEVIAYLQEKYPGRVAHIVSFNTFGGRMAVRDAARVLDIPHGKLERLHRVLPDDPRIPLKLAMARNPCLRAECDSDPACRQLVTAASVLEGLCRNTGTHASGIVISDIPLTVIVPLALDRDGQPVTQYSMEHLAGAGLLKIDLPGLRTLSVVRDALDLAAAGGKPAPDLDSIPHDDAATIDLLDCGNTVGVFQLERDGMRDLLRRLGPARMEDLVTALALYRPGATHVLEDFIRRKTGRAPCEPPHQLLRPVLKQTFGMLLFQEQLIAAICTLAGYTQGEADLLRRAMNGKDPEALDAMRDKFAGGCAKKHRMPRETADDIFDILSRSAGTGFNMAHGVALAALSYKTAYLKANLPAEFMAALLSSEMGEAGKIQAYINEANAMGLRILRPDINQSDARFLPTADGIRFGLCGIRNINGAAIDALLAERAARGPFAGLIDFCSRVDSQLVHRKVIESLLRAGCFDSTGLHRARLHRGLNAAMSCAAQALRDVHSGQASLFGVTTGGLALRDEDVMPDCERWHESRLLADEKELLGSYISGHPLLEYAQVLERYKLSTAKMLADLADGAPAISGGLVAGIDLKATHQGATMAVLRMDCLDGEIDVVVFPSVYARFSGMLKPGAMLFVCGTVRHEEPSHVLQLHARELCPLSEIHTRLAERLSVHIAATRPVDSELAKVKAILGRHPGPVPVTICLEYPGGEKVFLGTNREFSVMPESSLIRELEQIIGEHGVYVALKARDQRHP